MNKLITKSLELGDVHLLFGFPKTLLSKAEDKVLTWVIDYTSRYGKPPQVERLERKFPTFIAMPSADPLGDIYDETLTEKRNLYVREYLMEIQPELLKGADPKPYIENLYGTVMRGEAGVTQYTTFDRSAYHRRSTSYPYGIPILDKHTGGASLGDLIYIIGRLGTGKTTFALWIVTKWLMDNRRILMVSNENRAEDVIAKIDSYIGGFNPIKKRTMQWDSSDLGKLSTVSFIARNLEGEVFIPNKPVQDIEQVHGLIKTYSPDIVVVDGIYLMQGVGGDSHWEKITTISRSLKQLAESEALPVLGIHQANRQAIGKRIEVEHIAYADALAQDADQVWGINPEEDGSVYVESIKNRWGADKFGVFLKFHFDTMTVRVRDANRDAKENEDED